MKLNESCRVVVFKHVNENGNYTEMLVVNVSLSGTAELPRNSTIHICSRNRVRAETLDM